VTELELTNPQASDFKQHLLEYENTTGRDVVGVEFGEGITPPATIISFTATSITIQSKASIAAGGVNFANTGIKFNLSGATGISKTASINLGVSQTLFNLMDVAGTGYNFSAAIDATVQTSMEESILSAVPNLTGAQSNKAALTGRASLQGSVLTIDLSNSLSAITSAPNDPKNKSISYTASGTMTWELGTVGAANVKLRGSLTYLFTDGATNSSSLTAGAYLIIESATETTVFLPAYSIVIGISSKRNLDPDKGALRLDNVIGGGFRIDF